MLALEMPGTALLCELQLPGIIELLFFKTVLISTFGLSIHF